MSDVVQFSKRGNIGIITVNNPPVNALSHGVRQAYQNNMAPPERSRGLIMNTAFAYQLMSCPRMETADGL